jgi:hypothetical protein
MPQYLAVSNQGTQLQINQPLLKMPSSRRFRFYAYSFWRTSNGTSFAANPGQFAGSQSGFLGAAPIQHDREGNSELEFIFRGFAVPKDKAANEIGMGLNWHPFPNLPVNVAAEARFKANAGPTLVGYLVVAPKPLKLTPKLQVSTYAQIGAFTGKNAVQFFDANARMEFTLLSKSNAKIVVGPILSANVQNEKYRVEFGPSISADLGLGKTSFRLSADYRFQASGDEARRAGPSFTVSTSF